MHSIRVLRRTALAAVLAGVAAVPVATAPAFAGDTAAITAGFVTGRLLDPAGAPAANTAVNVTNDDTAFEYTGKTGADGSYRIQVQPDQTYFIGYAVGPVMEYVRHTFNPAVATRYFVGSGQTIRVNDQASALAGISGRLTDAAGAPARGVEVHVINDDTAFPRDTVTRADGTYDLSNQLAPGRYKVQFTAAGLSQYAHQKPDYNSADVVRLFSGDTAVVDDQLFWSLPRQ